LSAGGGRGGDAWPNQGGAASAHGPGGGGGGGWIFTSSAPTSASVSGGAHGITTTGNLTYGSFDGGVGQTATAAPAAIPGVSGGAECADLEIAKTGPATAEAGGRLTFSLSVTNHGPSSAQTVSVVDTLPSGVTFVSASGSGWSCSHAGNVSVTCTRPALGSGVTAPDIRVVVTAPDQAASITNTAEVSSATSDPRPSNDAASRTTSVVAASGGGSGGTGGGLAGTGADLRGLLALELGLILLGATFLVASRRSSSVPRGRHVRR
jgi:uncharacterized repeat protein (TIGR01451 family)